MGAVRQTGVPNMNGTLKRCRCDRQRWDEDVNPVSNRLHCTVHRALRKGLTSSTLWSAPMRFVQGLCTRPCFEQALLTLLQGQLQRVSDLQW